MANHSPNSGVDFESMDSAGKRMVYQAEIEVFEQADDFYRPFEGKSSDFAIQSKMETSKHRGSEMTFTVKSGLYGEAVVGDTEPVAANYEPIKFKSNTLQIGWIRHMTSFTRRAEEYMGLGNELSHGIPAMFGSWLGREKTSRLDMMFLHRGETANTQYAGSATSLDTITDSDTLGYDMIAVNNQRLRNNNGKPAYVGNKGKQVIKGYNAIVTIPSMTALKTDSEYKTIVREAGTRGDTNYLFEGNVPELDGTYIHERMDPDHDGEGPIGSALDPKAELGTAVTGAAAAVLTGGGSNDAAASTIAKYFRYFPKYAYPYNDTETLSTSGDNFYVAVVNPNDGGVDAGKFGFYEISTNGGTSLTIADALASGNDVGALTWSAAVNTNTLRVGANIYYVNSSCVPLNATILLGACAARRGYGSYKHLRTTDEQYGGHVKELYITSIFGQEPRRDRRDRCPGYVVIWHAVDRDDLPTPVLA